MNNKRTISASLLFWGVLLISLNYELGYLFRSTNYLLEMIPSVVGYLLIFLAAGQMREDSKYFERMRIIAAILLIANAISFVIKPLGPVQLNYSPWFSYVILLLVLIFVILDISLLWMMISGVLDIEKQHNCTLGGRTMRTILIAFICASIALPLLSRLAIRNISVLLWGLAAAASFISQIALLIFVWRATKIYKTINP